MGEEHGGLHSADLRDDPIDARADLLWCFAAGATVSEDHPPRSALVDLLWRETFVIAVVPLREVAVHRCVRGETGELAGLSGAAEWTGEHEVERRRR